MNQNKAIIMEEKISVKPVFVYVSLAAAIIGLITFLAGLFIDSGRTWANYLVGNYYFISLAIGASFFLAIQYITQSGWSAAFKRIPEAFAAYLPIAGILMLLLYFGFNHLYPWSNPDIVNADEIIRHKTPYLNVPFWIIRVIVFFGLWILMTYLLRKESLKEDIEGGLKHFNRSEFYSKVYIFILAITFSLATFDWTMSIETKWFSTIYAAKNFVSAFIHGTALIGLLVLGLNKLGYFKAFNDSHLFDFSKYLFILAIIWGYLWFCQYLLIWYANIPEETIYFIPRVKGAFSTFFFLNIILNWAVPFLVFLFLKARRSRIAFTCVAIILLIGMWVDLYLQIMPGSYGTPKFGLIEIGTFIGFAGLFAFFTGRALSKASIIPVNHPYLNESLAHHV